MSDENLGYIKATMERFDEKLDSLSSKLDKQDTKIDELSDEVQSVKSQLSTYKTITKTLGAAASTVILILTFEWGSIKHLWER